MWRAIRQRIAGGSLLTGFVKFHSEGIILRTLCALASRLVICGINEVGQRRHVHRDGFDQS